MRPTHEQIEDALYRHRDNEDWLRENLSGMTYAEGVAAALEWVLGNQTDDEFFDGLPEAE